MRWFEAGTPYDQDFGLNKVIAIPLIVVHELVEIENVKRMGLPLTRDVITKNLNKVDDAHIKAVQVELQLAESTKNTEHIRERLADVESWVKDPSITPENREAYKRLHTRYARVLRQLT